jgi:hypothetical protein
MPDEVDDNHDEVAAAEDALAALRRSRLVRSWTITQDGAYDVLVGRGTVSVDPLDALGVLALAADLRRDRVTQAAPTHPMGSRTTRYPLSDGRVLDHHTCRADRYVDEFPFSVYVPGGEWDGCAAVDFAARTKTEALALAALVRVRGSCARCGHHRPLVWQLRRGWLPDPTIRCPKCDVDATAGVTVVCRGCKQPIVANPVPGHGPLISAWIHEHSRSSLCDAALSRSGVIPVRLRAHLR